MDKKVLTAVSICAAIFLVWQNFYLKPMTEKQQAWKQQQAQISGSTSSASENATANVSTPTEGLSSGKVQKNEVVQNVGLGKPGFEVAISTQGGAVSDVKLSEYRGTKNEHLGLLIGDKGQLEISSPSAEWAYINSVNYTVQSRTKTADGLDQLTLAYDDSNLTAKRVYTVNPELFVIDQDLAITFKKQAPAYVFVSLKARREIPKEQQENERRQVYFNKSGGQANWTLGDIDSVKEDAGEGNWTAISSRYFLNALIDRGYPMKPQFRASLVENGDVISSLVYRVAGPSIQVPVRLYYGPKEIDTLKAAGKHLDAAVDFGWFTIFAYPMLSALKWFYKYVHNFGLAIILLTVLVKLLTYPLTFKSMKSMKEMQRIQPQLASLRERYKDDKETLNKEMLQLMRANGYNPMSGCLPMFIQMPIFVALYNVLYGAIDLYGQPFFGWIHDLSAKDPFYVTPALLALMMFLQQRLTPNTASDPAQQRMMMVMPLVFGFMMLWLPSGLTLYMLVNSVVSILQQLWINRSLGSRRIATA